MQVGGHIVIRSIVVVTVNVEDLLALHTQYSMPLSVRELSENSDSFRTQRVHIPSGLQDRVSGLVWSNCGVLFTCSEHNNIVFRRNLIHGGAMIYIVFEKLYGICE